MRESTVHDLALGFGHGDDLAVRREDAVTSGTTVPRVIALERTAVVQFHHVVDNGHREGVRFAGVVGLRETVDQDRRVGGGSAVTRAPLVTG